MSRLDDSISTVAYVLDVLRVYRDIVNSGCCNDCCYVNKCKYAPKPGQLVRYNCPHYERRRNNVSSNSAAFIYSEA